MRPYLIVLLAIVTTAFPRALFSQITTKAAPEKAVTATTEVTDASARAETATPSRLTLKKTISLAAGPTSLVGSPKCDADGSSYIPDAGSLSISKFSATGEQVATFKANSSPDVPQIDGAAMFTVGPNGDVYQLVIPHSYDRDVFIYNKDGSYKSMVKLDVGGPWSPSLFVVLPSGNFLATGQKWDRVAKEYVPFTGIFSSGGALLKELHLEDDGMIHELAARGDSRVVPAPVSGGLNFAISRGKMEIGSDGNVYLMRWLNPAVIYAISPGGEIERRFTVDPEDHDFTIGGMLVAGRRIAVIFHKGREGENVEQEIIKVVDLEGNKIATYKMPMVDGRVAFGITLACYTQNPEQFTFLDWTKDEKMVLKITEPQ